MPFRLRRILENARKVGAPCWRRLQLTTVWVPRATACGRVQSADNNTNTRLAHIWTWVTGVSIIQCGEGGSEPCQPVTLCSSPK